MTAREMFDWCIRDHGRFVYLPVEVNEARLEGKLLQVVFEEAWRWGWANHPLSSTIQRVMAGEERMFTPHLTSPSGWAELKRAFGLNQEQGIIALSDRSVVESIACDILCLADRESRNECPQEQKGRLVAVHKRYSPDQVRRIRRRIEEKLRKGDRTDIIRVAKSLGLLT